MPAKLSGLGRLPASTRGASRVATSASNIRWASARSHSHQGWPVLRAVVGAAGAADELLGHQVHQLPLVLDVPVRASDRPRRAALAIRRKETASRPPSASSAERGVDDRLAGHRGPLGCALRKHA